MNLCFVIFLAGISAVHGAVMRFDGDRTPDSSSYASTWTTVVFGGTGWSSDGDLLTLTTATQRGIWFGWAAYVNDTPAWSLSSNTVGNLVSMRAKLKPSSGEWSMYVRDPDGYHTGISLADSNTLLWSYDDAEGSHESTITLNTTEFHSYGLLLKEGLASLFIDGQVRGQAYVTPTAGPPIVLFGDGSGSSPTGFGSLVIDYAQVDLAPIPEPSTGLLWGLSALALRRRR